MEKDRPLAHYSPFAMCLEVLFDIHLCSEVLILWHAFILLQKKKKCTKEGTMYNSYLLCIYCLMIVSLLFLSSKHMATGFVVIVQQNS